MTNSHQSGFGQLSTLLWAFICYIFKMESYHFLSSLPALALKNYLLIGEAGWRGWPGVEWNLLFIAMRFCTRAHPRPGAGRPPPCTGPKHSRHRIHRLSVCASLGLYPRKPKQSWICMSRLEWRKGSLQLSGDHRKSWTPVPSSSAGAAYSTVIAAAGQGTHRTCAPLSGSFGKHLGKEHWGNAILPIKSLAWFPALFSGRDSAGDI